jgi:hypothetical protein
MLVKVISLKYVQLKIINILIFHRKYLHFEDDYELHALPEKIL